MHRCLRFVSIFALLLVLAPKIRAQFGIPLGANHPELSWYQIETEHFIIIYHDGLDSLAAHAAPIAEKVYHVVTTNLQTPLSSKVKIYISDNDEIKNAFASDDDHIFLWLRGILDDLPHSIRASGTSKWLRTVITHEFTHIVIAHATKTWTDYIIPSEVPRWFNEGMARFMEPDGWTTDLDVALRIATVSDGLNFNLDENLGGTLLYEAGQSLVRFIALQYGDSALVKIIHYSGGFGYDFDEAVKSVTKHSLEEIYKEWHKYLTVYYATSFGQHQELSEIGRKIKSGVAIVEAARLAPDGKRIAILGSEGAAFPTGFYLMKNDTSEADLLYHEIGIAQDFSWTSDGTSLLFSKLRFGSHGDLTYDLYKLNVESGSLTRITNDGHYEYPDGAHHSGQIAAIHYKEGGAELDLLNADGTLARQLTHFNDIHVQLYGPRWSPDDNSIAVSIFQANGKRDVAIIGVSSGDIRYLTSDSINDRYPVWSPKGDSIVFVTHKSGIPNLEREAAAEASANPTVRPPTQRISDVASDIEAWDWSGSKDSLLVTTFDYKDEVTLYWYPAMHPLAEQAISTVKPEPKYGKWRDIHWPLVTPTEDAMPPVAVSPISGYNSLAHLSPLIFLPFIGSDHDHGTTYGTQFGLATALTDPMAKHLLTGFLDWGDKSHLFGYDVGYLNNQLGFSIAGNRTDVMNFTNVVADQSLYERQQDWNFALAFAFPAPDDLQKLHFFSLSWNRRALTVWNPGQFDSIPSPLKPIDGTIQDITALYSYGAENCIATLGASHSDKKFGSDLTYTRAGLLIDAELPLVLSGDAALAITGRAVAQEGDILPQEFLGFTPYDQFQGGYTLTNLGGGTGLTSINDEFRLPGIRKYYYGNRVATLTAELRTAMVHNGPQLVFFYDIGSVWYGDQPTNQPTVNITQIGKTSWLQTGGLELRAGLPGLFFFGGGVAWQLVKTAQPDWYFRIVGGL